MFICRCPLDLCILKFSGLHPLDILGNNIGQAELGEGVLENVNAKT
jgi:hypothetical protein